MKSSIKVEGTAWWHEGSRAALIVGLAVFAAALFGILSRPSGLLASFWPANALWLGLLVRDRRLAGPAGWVSAVVAFLLADLLTGSSLRTSLWLTAGNVVEVLAGLWLFTYLDPSHRRLAHPNSVLRLLLVCVGVGLVAGVLGFVIEPLLFGRDAWAGATGWMAGELVNYMVVLPVVLTAPRWTGWPALRQRGWHVFRLAFTRTAAPVWGFAVALLGGVVFGGPWAIGVPLLALLWCALRYDLFTVSVLAFIFSMWTLVAASAGWLTLGAGFYPRENMASLRVGVMLAVLAQLAVASVMSNLVHAKEEAERASVAKSQFLAMMSHELRTPMTGVLGMADLMLQGDQLPVAVRDQVGLMRASTQSLLALVDDILDYSKLDADKLKLEAIDFSPRLLIGEVAALMAPSAAARGNQLVVQAEGLPGFVCGDPTRLRQVLYNLLGNAIKFTRQGSVDLVCESAETEDGVTLSFVIRDTGIGMSEAQRLGLFEAYAQADVSTARRFGGTGLGLTICKRLVEAMHGRIEVQSTPGKGSTFSFSVRLGRSAPTAERLQAEPAAPEAGVKVRILLADDDATNRFIVGAMLQRYGHQVTTVENGREAVDAVAAQVFDLVLMDLQMPEMDGISAAREIRERFDPQGRLAIVGLSASVPELVGTQPGGGLDGCLGKPVDWAALKALIGRVKVRTETPGGMS